LMRPFETHQTAVVSRKILSSDSLWIRAEMLRDVEIALTGSLPCIHEIDPVSGEHSTSEAAPEGSANYVHTGTLTRLSEESDAKLQTQVFDPIDMWISEVDVSVALNQAGQNGWYSQSKKIGGMCSVS